jgi:hypothetical protein
MQCFNSLWLARAITYRIIALNYSSGQGWLTLSEA